MPHRHCITVDRIGLGARERDVDQMRAELVAVEIEIDPTPSWLRGGATDCATEDLDVKASRRFDVDDRKGQVEAGSDGHG
jgi:hypothetical protein